MSLQKNIMNAFGRATIVWTEDIKSIGNSSKRRWRKATNDMKVIIFIYKSVNNIQMGG